MCASEERYDPYRLRPSVYNETASRHFRPSNVPLARQRVVYSNVEFGALTAFFFFLFALLRASVVLLIFFFQLFCVKVLWF